MEFRILGPLEVLRGGHSIDLGGPRQRAVLAALLTRANESVSVDYLCEAVWESPPASANSNLRTYVAGLRQRFRAAGEAEERFITRNGVYRIVVFEGELDFAVFDAATKLGERALREGDPSTASADFERALAQWRGRPLEDLAFGSGLPGELANLEERRLTAVARHADARIALGDGATVVGDLRRLLTQYPLREELWAQLMLALCQSGRQAEALASYATARNRLVEELGIDPGPRLRDLHERVLNNDSALVAQRPASPALPRQLPMDVAEFTGRARDLTALVEATAEISVIKGMAGVGKTRLAVRVGNELARRGTCDEIQLWADLRAFAHQRFPADPGEVLGCFLGQLGSRPGEIPFGLDARAALYRDRLAGKRALVVLDDAADEEQVRPLLPGSHCRVLVTTRRELGGLDGTKQVELDVFTEGEAIELLTRIVGQRRIAADPGAARRVVRECGCLPLAVAIAARRLESRPCWPLGDFAARLAGRRLDQLAVGSRGVRSAFARSYDGLPRRLRLVFRLLSLHPGEDFTGASAAALVGSPPHEGEPMLEALLDEHLLRQDVPGRYRMHPLLRDFASERLHAEAAGPPKRSVLDQLPATVRPLELGAAHKSFRHRTQEWVPRGNPRNLSGLSRLPGSQPNFPSCG